VVELSPPLVISEDQLSWVVEELVELIRKVAA
jgi:acetylornithine/succinyldiaminopimelate/putrescine aminotransferase